MMEVNDPKYNQRRVSVVKFFAELYNYRLVDSALVFKVNSILKLFKTKNTLNLLMGKHFTVPKA